VVIGIGDDAAVVEPVRNQLDVLTTDAAVEGVHFDRRFMPADAIGHRVLAANLSDLAAMGAEPRLALLSLVLPDALPLAELDAILDGFMALAARTGTALVGGNVTRSPGPLVIDVTLTGAAKRRKVLSRGGARPGDALFVTGTVGGAAAGLAWLSGQPGGSPGDADVRAAVERFLRPEPRLRMGRLVGRTRAASAAMDLSDGLADAVRQVAEASGTGATLDAAALPIDPGVGAVFGRDSALDAALSGGEDYELLFAVPRRAGRRFAAAARLARLDVAQIGVLTPPGSGLVLRTEAGDRPIPEGFEHFRPAPAAVAGPGR
jgi:thiamine-monophosphate kinase